MIWISGLNSNKVTKSLNFCWREIPIIVFGLHVYNRKKQNKKKNDLIIPHAYEV